MAASNFTIVMPPLQTYASNITIILPSLQTYMELLDYASYYMFSRHDCQLRDQSELESDTVFYFSLFAFIFYIYIMLITWTRYYLHSTFRTCATVLFLGDAIVLLTSWREAVLVNCVFIGRGDYDMAWESIGTLSMDLRNAVNCLLAIIRFTSLMDVKRKATVAYIGAAICMLFATTTFALSNTGNLSVVWYSNGRYRDRDIEPFQTIRTILLFILIGSSFLLYIGCFIRVTQLTSPTNTVHSQRTHRREFAIIVQSTIIFVGELLYIYASFWLGARWRIGSRQFNASLRYVGRPLCAGFTPFLYTIFVGEIRDATFLGRLCSLANRRKSPKTTVISVNVQSAKF